MKTIILISSLAASALVLSGCAQSTRDATASYDDPSQPTMAPVMADSGTAPAAPSEPGLTAASSSSSSSLSDPSVSSMPSAAASAPMSNPDPASGSLSSDLSSAPAPMAPSSPVLTDNTAPISSQAPDSAADMVSARISEWRLSSSDIQNDLDSGTPITRTSSSASAFTPTSTPSADGFSLSNTVKGRIASDRQLASSDIQAEATGSEVRLSGNLASAELVGRAIAIALDTPGVASVTSNIKLSSAATP